MPKVYLIARPTVRHNGALPDLRPLKAYGTLVVLNRPDEDPRRDFKAVVKLMWERLEGYKPTEDYIAWAGGNTICAVIMGYLLAEMEAEHFLWLRWDRDKSPEGKWLETRSYRAFGCDMTDDTIEDEATHTEKKDNAA